MHAGAAAAPPPRPVPFLVPCLQQNHPPAFDSSTFPPFLALLPQINIDSMRDNKNAIAAGLVFHPESFQTVH